MWAAQLGDHREVKKRHGPISAFNNKKKKATNSEIQIATITAFIPLTRSQPPVVKETSSGKFLEL